MKASIFLFPVLLQFIVTVASAQTPLKSEDRTDQETKYAESMLPPGKKWKLVWNDEFDGTVLDTTKWDFRLHIMQTRFQTYTDQGAELDGKGNLLLKLIEKDGHYYSSQLQTGRNFMDRPGNPYGTSKLTWPIADLEQPKFVHRYGYYEIRCKFQEQEGWWSAFWLQSPVIGSTLDPLDSGVEIDIMENFTRDGAFSHNIHWNGYGKDHRSNGSGERKAEPTVDGFHIFGLDWNPEGYIFYVDGKESWRVPGPVSHREQFILVSTECNGYRKGGPAAVLKNAKLPDYFIVDYVRVYDDVSGK